MAKKNILKHFFIIGFGTFFNLLLGLLTTPLITRLVNPIVYGKLSLFTMYSNIALMVLCLGLDQAFVRFFYECKSIKEKKSLLFSCLSLPIIFSILVTFSICTLTYNNTLVKEFGKINIIFLCIYTFIQIIYRFSLLLIRLEYKTKIYSILNIFLKLFYICFAIPLLLFTKFDQLFVLILSTVISAFLCLSFSIITQYNIWNIFSKEKIKCNISKAELIKYAYPYIFSMGITTLFQAIDKISLNLFCSYYELGVYSSTMSLVQIFAIVQSTFNTLWAPMALEHYNKDKNDKTFYQKGNQIITVIMFFIGIMLILFKDIFSILLGEKYREAAYILPFLIFNPIMFTISETTVSGLVFLKKSKLQVVVAIGSCITNFIGNFLLVPFLGGKGAAISTGISYIVFFTLRTYLSNKYFYVDFKLKKFYFMTFILCLYALYNTFISFNIGTIIIFIFTISGLLILYKDVFIFFIKYINESIKK